MNPTARICHLHHLYERICICQNTTNVERKKLNCHSETPGTVLSDRLPGKVVCFPSGVDKPARLTIGWYLDLLLMVFVFDKLNQNYHKY